MIDELEQMRRRRAARATAGLDTGDRVSITAEELGLDVPADAPRVDYLVAVVDGDRITLRTPDPSPAEPEHRPGARRSGRKTPPPVPPWARNRGRR